MKKLFLVGALSLFGAMNAQSAKFGLNAGMLTGFAKAKVPGYSETFFYRILCWSFGRN